MLKKQKYQLMDQIVAQFGSDTEIIPCHCAAILTFSSFGAFTAQNSSPATQIFQFLIYINRTFPLCLDKKVKCEMNTLCKLVVFELKGNGREGQSSQVQSYEYVSWGVCSSCMMLLGQQVCWDLPHRVSSASLSSLSSLNKDGHNLFLCFSLHLSPSCIIYHPCLFLSFGLPEPTSISVLSPFSLSTSCPSLWIDYSCGAVGWHPVSHLVLWVRVAHSNRE